jgi:hypothetical protein
MKKSGNIFLPGSLLLAFLLAVNSLISFGAPKQQYYEIRIYSISGQAQASALDAYLKDAYLPALHRAGISKVGVFKPVEKDTANFGKLVYVFIPYKNLDEYAALTDKLEKDKVYAEAGKSFVSAPYDNPPYNRHQTILLKAFLYMPQFEAPQYTNPASERIYELRSYESATEAKAAKKIEMFNQGGEIGIFTKLKFNAVFYAEVLAGIEKPNLMYMTSFTDIKSHDEHWKAFGETAEWKKLSGMEEYKNTVSKIHVHLLHAADYSDF